MDCLSLLRKLALLVASAVCLVNLTAAEPEPAASKESKNAALVYRQAFEQMPKLEEEENKLVLKAIGKNGAANPLDRVASTKLVEKFAPGLDALHRAAAMPECDWGLDYSLGPKLKMPHFGKGLVLYKVALLRARLRWNDGRLADGISDWVAVMRLSRQMGADALLLAKLVETSIETSAIYTVSLQLLQFDEGSLRNLASALDALPPKQKEPDVIILERRLFIGWCRAEIASARKDAAKRAELRKTVKEMSDFSLFPTPEFDAFKRSIFKTKKFLDVFAKAVDSLDRDVAQLIELRSLPSDQSATRMEAFFEEINTSKHRRSSPLSSSFFSCVSLIRSREQQAEAQVAMLRAAIAIQLGGDEALSTIEDPLADAPFEYQKWEGGFELKSKALIKDKPVFLTFGAARK